MLGTLDIIVRTCEEFGEDTLDIIADIAGLREGGRVGDRKRHVEQLRERLHEICLAASGRSDHQHVGLLDRHIVAERLLILAAHTLVVVVHCDADDLLRKLLPYHVLVETRFDLVGRRERRDIHHVGIFLLRLFLRLLLRTHARVLALHHIREHKTDSGERQAAEQLLEHRSRIVVVPGLNIRVLVVLLLLHGNLIGIDIDLDRLRLRIFLFRLRFALLGFVLRQLLRLRGKFRRLIEQPLHTTAAHRHSRRDRHQSSDILLALPAHYAIARIVLIVIVMIVVIVIVCTHIFLSRQRRSCLCVSALYCTMKPLRLQDCGSALAAAPTR